MAMYIADAAGHVMETITPGKKKKGPALKFQARGGSKKEKKTEAKEDVKVTDIIEPRVEQIIAIEETPAPDEVPIVEEPDDDTEQPMHPKKDGHAL
ncbi:Hypothetical predicted protein [Pelobates cultripes]|uniref:Uncharacterized protein n=1 Tax=Pelobates cultripes TaxID=61616 RepID=A0AAD1S0N8_PELCU|nr:Hypothetical predicted protein [Pelobates cultripes]